MSKNPVFGYLFGKKKPARLGAGVGVKKWSDCGLKSFVYTVTHIFLLATSGETTVHLISLCGNLTIIKYFLPTHFAFFQKH